MKRIIILVFILAFLLDLHNYQDVFNQNKLYIKLDEYGAIKEKRFYEKGLTLKIVRNCQIYNFHKIELKENSSDELMKPYKVFDNETEYLIYNDLETGVYSIKMLDNFGVEYDKLIFLRNSRNLSYDDLMEYFYPKNNLMITEHYDGYDTLRVNIIGNNHLCLGHNIQIYRDSLDVLTADIYETRNNNEQNNIKSINTIKLSDSFFSEFSNLEERISKASAKLYDKTKEYRVFEFMINNRRTYYIPIQDNYYAYDLKDGILNLIFEHSIKNEWEDIHFFN